MARLKPWLVKHKDGTCCLKHMDRKKPPSDAINSVPTLCDHWVTLPYGYEQGEPTCTNCTAALSRYRMGKKRTGRPKSKWSKW